jgi:DNA-binding MarR family transcriptional regulator
LSQDPADRRSRVLKLTRQGRDLLIRALPVWEQTHHAVELQVPDGTPEELRRNLRALS